MFDSVGGRCPVWLITDSAPECPAVCYPLTEEGRKSVPSGADLVMDVGKALSLDFGREVLFVRNLQQSGLEVIREGCLKEAELEVRLKGSRICTGIERRREEQGLSDRERVLRRSWLGNEARSLEGTG